MQRYKMQRVLDKHPPWMDPFFSYQTIKLMERYVNKFILRRGPSYNFSSREIVIIYYFVVILALRDQHKFFILISVTFP